MTDQGNGVANGADLTPEFWGLFLIGPPYLTIQAFANRARGRDQFDMTSVDKSILVELLALASPR